MEELSIEDSGKEGEKEDGWTLVPRKQGVGGWGTG